jgi:hypothetical protein
MQALNRRMDGVLGMQMGFEKARALYGCTYENVKVMNAYVNGGERVRWLETGPETLLLNVQLYKDDECSCIGRDFHYVFEVRGQEYHMGGVNLGDRIRDNAVWVVKESTATSVTFIAGNGYQGEARMFTFTLVEKK